MKYRYALAVTGIIEAPNKEHAELQVLMGTSLSTRIAVTGPDVVIQVQEVAEASPDNGASPGQPRRQARPMEH